MSTLEKLKAATSLSDVAILLGFKPSTLAYVLYHFPKEEKYTEFSIPKRGGGLRKILAPDARLKMVQRRLANILYLCLADIDEYNPDRRPLAHGFSKSLSIVTNASLHKRRRYVLNIDLEDFFPSINFGRVRGVLIKDKRFQLNAAVATVLAQIACHDNALPQGSPCSPVISNIVANLLDIRLVRLAKKHKCTYSRYADDITFSTSRSQFPPELAFLDKPDLGSWEVGPDLKSEIEGAGYRLNNKKTRMQLRGSRQITTGLLVNEKVNIRPEYYRTVRSMCSAVFNTGRYYQMIPAPLEGADQNDPDVRKEMTDLAVLEGRLGHIHYVRDSVDSRKTEIKRAEPTTTRRLYYRLLFYKNFVALDKPLIITEGKTDPIYIKAAIRMLPFYQPILGVIEDKALKLTFRFWRYSKGIDNIIGLHGGSGDLKRFILHYEESLTVYRHLPLAYPVILLIDNDAGANEIFGVLKQFGITASHDTAESFYRLNANLYLIKTPETAGQKTNIEDLFDQSLRETELDGKRFDADMKHGELHKYGKRIFAEHVVKPNRSTINFSRFTVLLDRIAAVIDDYKL